MSSPVYPNSMPPTWLTESPQEKEKMSEVRFQTALLRAYLSVTGHNGSLAQALEALENEMSTGKFSEQLANNVNQIITQLNQNSDKAPFPAFSFSTEGPPALAISHFALSLEKFINCTAEKGDMDWTSEKNTFKQLAELINNSGEMAQNAAFKKLNEIIDAVNQQLPAHYHLPTIYFARGD